MIRDSDDTATAAVCEDPSGLPSAGCKHRPTLVPLTQEQTMGSMQLVREMVVCCPTAERIWREQRAVGLARILAWEEVRPNREMTDRVANEITEDIGTVNPRWLRAQIAVEKDRIVTTLVLAGRVIERGPDNG